jgi:hypothetical protein
MIKSGADEDPGTADGSIGWLVVAERAFGLGLGRGGIG